MGAFQSFVIMPLTFLSGVFYSVEQLPDFWAKASLLNPFFYMIDGFRYGFFGRSDFDPYISLFVTGVFCATAVAIDLVFLDPQRRMSHCCVMPVDFLQKSSHPSKTGAFLI